MHRSALYQSNAHRLTLKHYSMSQYEELVFALQHRPENNSLETSLGYCTVHQIILPLNIHTRHAFSKGSRCWSCPKPLALSTPCVASKRCCTKEAWLAGPLQASALQQSWSQKALECRREHLVYQRQRLIIVPEEILTPPEGPGLSKFPAGSSRNDPLA